MREAARNSDQGGLLPVPFRPITEPIPEFVPWTSTEQTQIGARLRLPPEKWQWISKHPALCIPQSRACLEWLEWAEARENLPVGAGFVVMDESEYNRAAAKLLIPHTAKDQEESVLLTGKPIAFYQWLTHVDEPAQGSSSP
jgi:hypothetical protein